MRSSRSAQKGITKRRSPKWSDYGGPKLGTPDDDRLDVLATLIDAYESIHDPIDPPDPIEAIKFRMESSRGSRGRTSSR
jgi:antitoxin component HigA of HigAB toxin-antitoxin module